jgi:hypothetical protein
VCTIPKKGRTKWENPNKEEKMERELRNMDRAEAVSAVRNWLAQQGLCLSERVGILTDLLAEDSAELEADENSQALWDNSFLE